MEVGKKYKFKYISALGSLNGREFHLLKIAIKNCHIQIVGEPRVRLLNKSLWNFSVEGEVKEPVQGHSVLIHKFI
jgi:hypothetical protein